MHNKQNIKYLKGCSNVLIDLGIFIFSWAVFVFPQSGSPAFSSFCCGVLQEREKRKKEKKKKKDKKEESGQDPQREQRLQPHQRLQLGQQRLPNFVWLLESPTAAPKTEPLTISQYFVPAPLPECPAQERGEGEPMHKMLLVDKMR